MFKKIIKTLKNSNKTNNLNDSKSKSALVELGDVKFEPSELKNKIKNGECILPQIATCATCGPCLTALAACSAIPACGGVTALAGTIGPILATCCACAGPTALAGAIGTSLTACCAFPPCTLCTGTIGTGLAACCACTPCVAAAVTGVAFAPCTALAACIDGVACTGLNAAALTGKAFPLTSLGSSKSQVVLKVPIDFFKIKVFL